jgi:L-alanine-DL-glutamate epimerase-like enolase superfamily enzyme
VKITDVEAIVLRRHDPVQDISDGTQDTLLVRIHTDAGLVGIGEVDSAPEVVKAAIEAPKSHLTCSGFRQLLLGEDPCDVGRLWEKLYRGSLYFGRRGVGIHALSGIDIALWDLFKTGILKAATLHLLAALPEAPFLEFCVWDSSLAHDLVEPRFWIDGDGMVAVPQGPGLGVTLNDDVVRRYRVG